MKVNEKETAQSFINTLFIPTRATLLQRYLSAYTNNVESNEVATLRSFNRESLYYVLLANKTKIQQQQIPLISLRSPFNLC